MPRYGRIRSGGRTDGPLRQVGISLVSFLLLFLWLEGREGEQFDLEGAGLIFWDIDAQDDPPRSCGVNFQRDCIPKEGCVVSAIANMVRICSLKFWCERCRPNVFFSSFHLYRTI